MHVPKYTHFSDYWSRTSVVIHVYKARARRNRYAYFSLHTVAILRGWTGGGGTGIRGAESGVEGAESGVEWAESGVEGAGSGDRGGGIWGGESRKIGAGN